MADFIILAFSGLALGCIYALVALGFTIIFKASEVINFAQGEFLFLGAFLAWAGVFAWHLNFFLALLIAIVVTVLVGVAFERLALRRMIGRPVFSIIMVTIGLQVILNTGILIAFPKTGSGILSAAAPYDAGAKVSVAGIPLLVNDIWTIVVTIVCCAALYVFFRYTRYGLAMRATALDQEAAQAMGINVKTVYALAWGIAATVATIGGVFLAISLQALNNTLDSVALIAFPAIILGGLDSIPGAVVGGVVIGLIYQLTNGYEGAITRWVGPDFYSIAPYLVMIVILLVRPYGLFGTRKVERI